MEWKTAYIVVRPDSNGHLAVVHVAATLKDTRYWLQYIAQAKDAIFTTSLHPKYQGNGQPIYMAHLVSRGKIDYNEAAWKESVFGGAVPAEFTFVEGGENAAAAQAGAKSSGIGPETALLQLKAGKPSHLSLEELQAVLQSNIKKFEVVLAEPSKWIDWESALTLMTRDMYVIGVDRNSKWPLTVTLKPKDDAGQTMHFEPDMRFIVRPRTY